MSAKDFLLIGFSIVLFLMLLLLVTYSRKTANYCRSLQNELENLRGVVRNYRLNDLPLQAFQQVVTIHQRSVLNKKALSSTTKLSAYFLTLTAIWLQTPALLHLLGDIRLFSENFLVFYAIVQTMLPCVAFVWLVWKIQDSSGVVMKLKEVLSQCQLESLPK